MEKVVVATLYRFGIDATVVCHTEEEARRKLIDWYEDEYIHVNGSNPKDDVYAKYPNGETDSYYDEADSCIEIQEYVVGSIEFR